MYAVINTYIHMYMQCKYIFLRAYFLTCHTAVTWVMLHLNPVFPLHCRNANRLRVSCQRMQLRRCHTVLHMIFSFECMPLLVYIYLVAHVCCAFIRFICLVICAIKKLWAQPTANDAATVINSCNSFYLTFFL